MDNTYRHLETLEVKDESSVVNITERSVFIYLGVEVDRYLNTSKVNKWQLCEPDEATSSYLMEAIPMCLGTIKIGYCPSNTTSFII